MRHCFAHGLRKGFGVDSQQVVNSSVGLSWASFCVFSGRLYARLAHVRKDCYLIQIVGQIEL